MTGFATITDDLVITGDITPGSGGTWRRHGYQSHYRYLTGDEQRGGEGEGGDSGGWGWGGEGGGIVGRLRGVPMK